MSSTKHQADQPKDLLEHLQQHVKYCQIRFINRYELATELDQTVQQLCDCLEQIFMHGLKNQTKFLAKSKLLNGIVSSSKKEISYWNFISLYLTEHEVTRFASLRNVHTDRGRGRSWIRNSLNEHSLEKYMSVILEDKSNFRKQFYHEWAFLLDQASGALLSQLRNLNSILFALNIDNADLDVCVDPFTDSTGAQENLDKLAPVRRTENTVLIKSSKRKSNIISIKDEEEDEDQIDPDIYAQSAPVSSFLSAPSCSLSDKINQLTVTSNLSDNKSDSSFSINENVNVNMVLYPLNSDDTISSHSLPVQEETDVIKQLEDKIDNLEFDKDKLQKENSLLNIQLKKYIAAIELLKYSKKDSNSGQVCESVGEETDERKVYNYNDIKDYEKKLMQVSEMHGELVEFNEHLYKVIQLKDSIISRLRDELVELRGPLPDSDEILSIVSEAESNSHSLQALPLPLIHVWIPTAFLSGGFKGKSHHIYQIYIRIKEEEWNVYRRYSQFYTLNRSMKEKYRCIAQFEFPPKKAIGNKDSKVVQERRKKLEFYLRNLINFIQTQHADINNKEKLITILPFLSDKYFMQDRSQSESNLSNTQQQQQSQQQSTSQHYMGF